MWHVKNIVAATEFCRCDLLHEFKLVWIHATHRSDKISASSRVATCVRICDKSLRQNLNQPMMKHQLVSCHVKFWTSLHFLSFKIDCVDRTSVLSQRLDALIKFTSTHRKAHLSLPYLTRSPWALDLTSSHLTPPHLTSPHPTLPHLTSPYRSMFMISLLHEYYNSALKSC